MPGLFYCPDVPRTGDNFPHAPGTGAYCAIFVGKNPQCGNVADIPARVLRSASGGSLIAAPPVERVIAAMIGAALLVAVDVQGPVYEAMADHSGDRQIGCSNIADDLTPALDRCRKGQEGKHGRNAESCDAIDRTNIFYHK